MLGKAFHQNHNSQTQRTPGIEVSNASHCSMADRMTAAECRSESGSMHPGICLCGRRGL